MIAADVIVRNAESGNWVELQAPSAIVSHIIRVDPCIKQVELIYSALGYRFWTSRYSVDQESRVVISPASAGETLTWYAVALWRRSTGKPQELLCFRTHGAAKRTAELIARQLEIALFDREAKLQFSSELVGRTLAEKLKDNKAERPRPAAGSGDAETIDLTGESSDIYDWMGLGLKAAACLFLLGLLGHHMPPAVSVMLLALAMWLLLFPSEAHFRVFGEATLKLSSDAVILERALCGMRRTERFAYNGLQDIIVTPLGEDACRLELYGNWGLYRLAANLTKTKAERLKESIAAKLLEAEVPSLNA